VHGFHEQFEHAARRTAQLAYDLNFHGVPVLYSWPTKGTYEGYPADEASAEWTAPHFRQFLELLASASGDRAIHVLAHSMGTRVVTGALGLLREDQRPAVVRDLILAAPDVDADVFEARAETLRAGSGMVTLYASSRDRALQLSQFVHQGRRAGQSGPPAVVADSIDTIDASNIDTDLIGHGYFSENKAIIDDLFMLIRFGFLANDRNLREAMEGSKQYFMLP
jgi:esterase/lipase superfamily enzyme